jgi:ABC-type multidrug transport system permease subunit
MNIREGARRMQYIGRIVLSLTAAAFVLIILVSMIGYYTSLFPPPLAIILLCFFPAILGTLFLATGWIVEGFALPPQDSSAGEHARD